MWKRLSSRIFPCAFPGSDAYINSTRLLNSSPHGCFLWDACDVGFPLLAGCIGFWGLRLMFSRKWPTDASPEAIANTLWTRDWTLSVVQMPKLNPDRRGSLPRT